MPLGDDVAAAWPWSGAWTWPVGAACEMAVPSSAGEPAWRVLRGFTPNRGGEERHLGVDFGNGRAHDAVRAAAHGMVVVACDRLDSSGFGAHVVLAHRLREGGIAYSVYSHLTRGSILVRAGASVWAGDVLGEVGRSGNATADHLHFEVRLSRDPAERWELAPAVDPVAWVERRLPTHRADTTWAAAYLDWADRAGLLEPGAHAGDPLSRGAWLVMLSRAARLPLMTPPADAASLREALIANGLLTVPGRAPLGRAPSWRELRRSLAPLAALATRLPPGPLGPPLHRLVCISRFGVERPLHELEAVFRRNPPTVGDACLLLADLAGGGPGPQDRPR